MGRTFVVAAVLALALTASSAGAVIVVQRSIGGVKLQMTKAQVRAKLGRPMRVRVGSNEFGTFVEKVYRCATVTFQSGDRVTAVRTTSPLERTGRDVGVGSTAAQLRAGVRDVRCRNAPGFKYCAMGKFLPGRIVTEFRLRNGRVSAVIIGFVID